MRLDPSRDGSELAIATQLRRRRRRLLAAVGALTVATLSSAGWAVWAEISAGRQTVFWQPTGFSPSGQVPAPLTADSAPVQLVVAPPPPPPPPPAPSPRVVGLSEPKSAVVPRRPLATPVRDSVSPPVPPPPVLVTITEPPPPRVIPPPPPPPPRTVVDSATARASREAQMALAAEAGLRGLHGRLRDAISRADRGELERLWPPGTGAGGSRERFLDFVASFRPEATLGPSEPPTILGDIAQSKGTIVMTWRGNFGVSRSASATFVLALRRSGDTWTSEGIHLTARFP